MMKSTAAVFMTVLTFASQGHAQTCSSQGVYSQSDCTAGCNGVSAKTAEGYSVSCGSSGRSSVSFSTINGVSSCKCLLCSALLCGSSSPPPPPPPPPSPSSCTNNDDEWDVENGLECTMCKCPTELTTCQNDLSCAATVYPIILKVQASSDYRLTELDVQIIQSHNLADAFYQCGVSAGCPNLYVVDGDGNTKSSADNDDGWRFVGASSAATIAANIVAVIAAVIVGTVF